MALTINTNVAALNAHRNMIATDNKLSASLERLSTGLRINKAADDASGMLIADSLRAQHMGIGQAIKNANDGISIVQTADGALEESINIINTIKTKAIQAASDGQTSVTRTAIQNDVNKLMEELSVIAKTTSYNGQKLLSGGFTNKKFQVGAFANETVSLSIGSTEANKMGHITQANLSLASDRGGEVQLTITSSITGEELTLNKIDIQSNNKAENGMGALADELNRYASSTGISAIAIVTTTSEGAVNEASTNSNFSINGKNIGEIKVLRNDSNGALAKAINGKTAEHGVTAAVNNDGSMTLTSSDGRAIEVEGAGDALKGSMSTQGYLALSQKGVSNFQINGIGAGATGENITISGDVTTVKDSILSSGSTIKAGSELAGGTIIGGDVLVESSISSTQLDYEMKSGSTLYSFSEIAKGTVLGGSVTVGGNTATTAGTNLEQDMLLSSGSTLKTGSVLGVGTVVTTDFTANSVDYSVGDTLVASVTLTEDLTLSSDMNLKYSSTSAENSKIMADSTLSEGSQLGAKFEIGATYDTGAATVITVGVATTEDLRLGIAMTAGNSAGNMVVKAGSLLADGSLLDISTAAGGNTWTGPTLMLSGGGMLEQGDTFTSGVVTLDGDQVMSEDLSGTLINSTAAGTSQFAAGSVLTTGSVSDNVAGASGHTTTLSTATIATDMTLENGSELSAGSKLLSGSTLGDATYVMGGSLNATATDISTYSRTELKANSTLQDGSIMAEGSTIGGTITVSGNTTLDSDMSLTSGTTLLHDTKFEQGTLVNQNMTLYSASSGGGGTAYELKAGDVITQDLWVTTDGGAATATVTLSEDMMLKADSIIGASSELAINTVNAGTVGLGETESYRLSDLNLLTQEGAQRAIDIAEAALSDLDNIRSGLGSVQNQLVSTISNLSVTKTNIQASESAIRDVDFAEEASNFSKMQLLSQTGSYALAQANAASQNIMSLLQ